jgi:hypothetical protein
LIEPPERLDGLVLAEHDGLEVAVEVLAQRGAVVARDVRGGMRAILATISSISFLPMTFFCRDFGRMRWPRRPRR